MKIAIFTDSFYPGMGGTEKATLGLANALVEDGNEVFLGCPKYNMVKEYEDNFNFIVARTKSIPFSVQDNLALPSISKEFKQKLKEFAPDIIHCQSISGMANYAIKYGKANNIPVCITVHTKFKTTFSHSIKSQVIVNGLIKHLVKNLNNCDQVFTVCNDMKQELKEYGYNGNVIVVRNGAMFDIPASLEAIKNLALDKYGLKNDETKFLFVGHLVKYKNVQLILDSLVRVKNMGYKFKMLFVGGGYDEKYFKQQVEKCGLSKQVIFAGRLDDNELFSSIYASSELFLFPSLADNDPLVIVEAAIHKTPSLTIQGTGSSERIIDGVSGFVTQNNVKAFADKIVEIINDKELLNRVGENAQNMVPKLWSRTAKEYAVNYEKIIQNKKLKSPLKYKKYEYVK